MIREDMLRVIFTQLLAIELRYERERNGIEAFPIYEPWPRESIRNVGPAPEAATPFPIRSLTPDIQIDAIPLYTFPYPRYPD